MVALQDKSIFETEVVNKGVILYEAEGQGDGSVKAEGDWTMAQRERQAAWIPV